MKYTFTLVIPDGIVIEDGVDHGGEVFSGEAPMLMPYTVGDEVLLEGWPLAEYRFRVAKITDTYYMPGFDSSYQDGYTEANRTVELSVAARL